MKKRTTDAINNALYQKRYSPDPKESELVYLSSQYNTDGTLINNPIILALYII